MEIVSLYDLAWFFLALGLLLMLAEALVYTFGFFAITGTLFYLGGTALLWLSHPLYAAWVWFVMGLMWISTLVFVFFVIKLAVKSAEKPVVTGWEGLRQETGQALETFNAKGRGRIRIHGEEWEAYSTETIHAGDEVMVIEIKNLVLTVKRKP